MLYHWRQRYTSQGDKTRSHAGRGSQGAPPGKRGTENGAGHAKKNRGLLREAAEIRYRLIAAHPEYPESKWARFLRVSRSSYYEWKKTREERERRARDYAERVRRVFEESGGVYGADRICGTFRSRGYGASFRKVRECMSSQGLRSIHMRRRQRSLTDSVASRGDGYANLVKGNGNRQAVSGDIERHQLHSDRRGIQYLCQIRDVASGMILAAGMSDHMKAELVLDTIRKVVLSWDIPEGCIFHSDRGSQYASEKVMKYLGKRRIRQSFSRVGTPGDNSWSRKLLLSSEKRIGSLGSFPYEGRGPAGDVRIHRGLLQHEAGAKETRLPESEPMAQGVVSQERCRRRLTFCPEKC